MLAAATVRAAVAALLATVPGSGARVFQGRAHPLDEAELPCWSVSLGSEDIELEGLSWPALQNHRLSLTVEGHARSVDTLETTLDALQAAGLQALFGGGQPPHQLRCTASSRRASETDAAIGSVTLELEARFLTVQNAPETIVA